MTLDSAMDRLVTELRAAAEPTRLRILALCADGELSVSDLTHILGQSQPRVSRHLKLLGEAGLLERIREGTFAYFRVAQLGPGSALARLLVSLLPADDPVARLDRERLQALKRGRAEAAMAYFRENAAQWDEIRALHIADSEVERAVSRMVPVSGIGDLLDLGTGTGRMLTLLGNRVDRAVGLDLSKEMLAIARANLDRAGLPHCQVRLGDLYQLPLPGDSVDIAIMHQVLHYLEDPADALAEAARVLRPGGRLLVVDFGRHNVDTLRSEHAHRWLGFDDEQLREWLSAAGLRSEEPVRLPGNPLTVTIWLSRRPADAASRTDRPAMAWSA